MTTVEEILPNPEHEEVDGNIQEGFEPTKELFRREVSPPKEEIPPPHDSPKASPKDKTPSKPIVKALIAKKEIAIKKKSCSGIPRLKSGTNTVVKKGTYRHAPLHPIGPVINKNTLEVQFMNNKKRLLQLHADLVERQRPLLDMHKSLQRTRKQLEELGKKVVLEDLKFVTLRNEEALDGAGENPVAETAISLKQSIDDVLDSCVKVCKKCLVKRDNFVKVLENVSKTTDTNFEAELEELKKEKGELERSLETTIVLNEKKMSELINNWQKTVKMKALSDEVSSKMNEFEETIKQQQKAISDAEDNLHNMSRKYEEKRLNYDKQISELNEKIAKLEEELKKEKKVANEHLMKSRNFRGKLNELEVRAKEAEERNNETSKKIVQVQEQMRKKEVQWLKEKDDFKKHEALLQQKFAEKQNQFDTRIQDMEKLQKSSEMQKVNFCRTFETQLEIKDQEFMLLEQEKLALGDKSEKLERDLEEMKRQIEEKEKEIDELSLKAEKVPAIEYRPNQDHLMEMIEYKQKMEQVENNLQQQTEQISKMQSSLKAHAQLAAALKLEKDNAFKYANKLRKILQEARDEIEFKNKTIYKIHEKLVLKEKTCEKLQSELKDLEECGEFFDDKWKKNKCQICLSSLAGEKQAKCSSLLDTEEGKSSYNSPKYVSESLIGMSVKKVDNLRARLDNLKKMRLPSYMGSSSDVRQSHDLRKQIEMRGKLYKILQKHADQSCEDFINLLKLTVSNSTKGELKPSTDRMPPSRIKITESLSTFSQSLSPEQLDQICDKLNRSLLNEEDMLY